MNDNANYGLVGAFVLVLGAMLVASVLWLAAGMGGRQVMDRYQAVVQESVAGLDVDAPVKYLGVNVGKVSRIEIDPQNSEQVRLALLVVHGTPIKRDSVAVLKSQGLTGIAYIELSGGNKRSEPLLPGPDGQAPTIPFKLSLSARLENVLTDVVSNVGHLAESLNSILDKDNRLALKKSLANFSTLSQALASQQGNIRSGMTDAAHTAKLMSLASEQIKPTLEHMAASAQALERMAEAAGTASTQAGVAANVAGKSALQLSTETLPEIARLMAELTQLSESLRLLSEQTASSPSSLLLGLPRMRLGPGETSTP